MRKICGRTDHCSIDATCCRHVGGAVPEASVGCRKAGRFDARGNAFAANSYGSTPATACDQAMDDSKAGPCFRRETVGGSIGISVVCEM